MHFSRVVRVMGVTGTEREHFIHVMCLCIMDRYPYFWNGLIEVDVVVVLGGTHGKAQRALDGNVQFEHIVAPLTDWVKTKIRKKIDVRGATIWSTYCLVVVVCVVFYGLSFTADFWVMIIPESLSTVQCIFLPLTSVSRTVLYFGSRFVGYHSFGNSGTVPLFPDCHGSPWDYTRGFYQSVPEVRVSVHDALVPGMDKTLPFRSRDEKCIKQRAL